MNRIAGILFFLLACLFNSDLSAQNYNVAVGARFWYVGTGLSVKGMLTEQSSLEAIVEKRTRGWRLIGMYEHHFYPFRDQNVSLYAGGGGHTGYWITANEQQDVRFLAGLDLIGGIEFFIPAIPFSISADYKPFVELKGLPTRTHHSVAVSVRYAFGR
jgi:hypothetical protein